MYPTRLYNRRMESYSSFLTWRFDTALQFAFGLYHQQPRKGVSIPYIAHLMSVCALVIEAGGDEDQGGRSTLDTIRHMFGDRVADTVESCSDSMATNPSEKSPWRERKNKYLEHLRAANADALFVSAADKLHNARAILSDYREIEEQLFLRFNASKEDQLWYYNALVEALRQTTAPKVLIGELERVVKELNRVVKAQNSPEK